MAQKPAQFRVDPLVVYRLGEELITDEIQALLELVKNAYDADASYARVTIDTQAAPKTPGDPPGYIEIADDGFGMNSDTVIGAWLLIARSPKQRFKEEGKLTPKERTPLGDKGLGRLGTQRLGWELEIATKTAKAAKELVVAFSWEDFFTAESLDQVEVDISERVTERKHGTVLTVRSLRDPERWRGGGITALQRELSQVISPYEGVSGFTVSVMVDGTRVDLQTLNRQVRETAQLHYDIDFNGKRLRERGSARISFFRPNTAEQRREFERLVEADGGQAFRAHLREAKGTRDLGLEPGKGKWFLSFERTRQFADIDPALDDDGKPANPGRFRAEVDSFDLGAGSDERLEVFGTLKPYREFIKQLAGIRVYRDGFRVRVEGDWLGLAAQWTSARSYYGLKPDTTTGYVAITSRENPQLVEKTDREGFTETPHFRSFTRLLGDFLEFTGEIQGGLRREYTKFVQKHQEAAADVPPDTSPEAVAEDVSKTLAKAGAVKNMAASVMTRAETAIARTERAVEDDGGPPDERLARANAATAELRAAMASTRDALRELQEYLTSVANAEAKTKLVRSEIAALRDQLTQGVEAMGLGLTAEALSHEMFTIADGLASRTQTIHSKVSNGGVSEAELRRYLEHVRGSVTALRKELSHFAPSLRFVRERREIIEIQEFADEVVDYYRSRWDDRRIRISLRNESKGPFDVRTSRGKLTQVLDNLLLNSEYWIGVAQRQKRIDDGRVVIALRRPFMRVSDNGPGVEPAAEESLFEPFVTRKPRGTGRGLGLFIVKQLLDSEGCDIVLAPERNDAGRRYRFDIDLSGVLSE
jgi:signal transduction histidine kinase